MRVESRYPCVLRSEAIGDMQEAKEDAQRATPSKAFQPIWSGRKESHLLYKVEPLLAPSQASLKCFDVGTAGRQAQQPAQFVPVGHALHSIATSRGCLPAESFFQYSQHIRLSGFDPGIVPDFCVQRRLFHLFSPNQTHDIKVRIQIHCLKTHQIHKTNAAITAGMPNKPTKLIAMARFRLRVARFALGLFASNS